MLETILVTGGAGYIGSRLIRDLAADYAIRIYDNMQRETYQALMDLPETGQYQFIEGDILDNSGIRRALQDVTTVIHLAAIVRTPLSFGPRGWTEQVNHWGTANLVEAALAAGVKTFIFTSTASVYGPVDSSTGAAYRETDSCRPLGPYAESKLRAERQLQTLSEGKPMQTAILRLGNVFGQAHAARFDTVANRFAYLASIRRPLSVFGTGEQRRPLIHIQDASAVIRFALEHIAAMDGNVYNVAGEHASVLQLVEAVKASLPVTSVHYTEQDVLTHLSYGVDCNKIHNLGWNARISIEAGLAEMINHMRGFEAFASAIPDFP